MAVSSIVLDIRANTERALNDFKKFSSQLDNKFLVSGLKLDVVRSALGQINREFQKSIGEQGLQAGMSLKAAENQASAIMDVFKSVGPEASKAITEQFSTAFSEIAVKAGGTSEDIKKALSATSFISTNLSADVRKSIAAGIMEAQRDFKRAGLGDDFGGLMRKFMAGEINAGDMQKSGNAMEVMAGNELMRVTNTISTITNAEEKSKAIQDAFGPNTAFTKNLNKMAKEAYGFRATIDDLNSYLFNPKAGVFGALKEVTMSVGDKTTVFKETGMLVESVFGRQGLFVNFFKQIGKIFGIEDPLKVIIIGIRFVTRQFNKLNAFVQSPEIQGIVKKIQEAFTVIKDFATSLYNAVTQGFSGSVDINASIRSAGEQIREFIEGIGESIRNANVEEQGTAFLNTFTTVVGEVAQTLGTAIKEAILLVFSGKGAAVLGGAIKVLYEGLSRFFSGLFGGNQGVGAALGGTAMAALGVLFVRRIRGALESILRPIQALGRGGGGAGGFVNRLLGGGGRGGVDLDPSARGPSSILGGAQAFQRQVVFYLQRIANCVCGPGGLGGPDLDGPRNGRNRTSSLGYGGPRRPAEIPDVRRSYLASSRESARNILGRGSSSAALEAYTESLRGPYADLDVDQRREISSRNAQEGGQRTADRYNRRYSRRARLGRGIRGFGKGALIAGGVTAGLSLLGMGSANASEMGEGTPATGAGQAWGAVGMGAAQGALTGAGFGPWGAAIGGVIGGGVALMDKGVRDAIVKSLSQFATNIGNNTKKLWDGLVSNVMKTFDGIKSFAGSIDWKNVLLDTFLPGRALLRAGAEAAGLGGGKKDESWLGTMKNAIADVLGINRREAGGTAIKGTSYIVGERGPEIFTPGASGSISSNRDLMTMRSGGGSASSVSANFNITIQVNSNMGVGDVEALRGPVLRIVEEAWASATQGSVSRGSMA